MCMATAYLEQGSRKEELLSDVGLIARNEGIYPCPEGASTLSALKKMLDSGVVDPDERVVLFNTGSGLKYVDLFQVKASTVSPDERFDYNNLRM